MSEGIRLNKYMAQAGLCSRREADRYIDAGQVYINGQKAQMGQLVYHGDKVTIGSKQLRNAEEKVVLAWYKPIGVTCTEKDPHAKRKIGDVFRYPVRVTYAGRLDKDSEGLLIMTNDGDLINRMMRGSNGHEKEYIVKVDKELTEEFCLSMQQGVYLAELDRTTRPCDVSIEGKYTFRIILTQGLNRQIRRMCETLGYQVKSLKRIRVVNVKLGDLKPGEYREVTGAELKELYASCR
jgi:23S rRNA pseudouridine2604 synthase